MPGTWAAGPAVGGEQHDIMPFGTRNRATPNGPAGLGRTTDYVDDTTHHPAAGGDGGANSAHHGTERRDPGPGTRGALQAAADAADAQVAAAQQDVLDASEPPQGIPRHVESAPCRTAKKTRPGKTAATAAHAKVTEAQQVVAQAQAQVQAADRQVAAATAAVQATKPRSPPSSLAGRNCKGTDRD